MMVNGNGGSNPGDGRQAAVEKILRQRVHSYLESAVLPHDDRASVLELGCQGANAVFLGELGHRVVATNSDETLLERARRGAEDAGVGDHVVFRTLDLVRDRPAGFEGAFDIVIGDFGILNTLQPDELRHVAVAATSWVREGGRAIFLTMPPLCAWESFSNVLRFRWRQVGQRSDRAVPRSVRNESPGSTWYHQPAVVGRTFEPAFTVKHLEPLGLTLPPLGGAGPVSGSAPVLTLLSVVERMGRVLPAFARCSDHYLVDLQRTAAITVGRKVPAMAPRSPRFATEPLGRMSTRRGCG